MAARRGMSPRGFALQSFLGGSMSPYSGLSQSMTVKGAGPQGQDLSPTHPNQSNGPNEGMYDAQGAYYPSQNEQSKAIAMGLAAGMVQDAQGNLSWPKAPAAPAVPQVKNIVSGQMVTPEVDVPKPKLNILGQPMVAEPAPAPKKPALGKSVFSK